MSETDEELARARRLEAIGRLTGSIAHEFNNLLTGIIGYASLLKSTLPENGKDRQAAVFIDRSAQRAADLTKRLLLHLRKETPIPRAVDIGKVIGEATGILSRTARANVEIRTDFLAPPEPVMGDSRELVQALLELGANAADAMPDGGTITFTTSIFVSDGEVLVNDSPVSEGRYVSISVSDTGTGIPESIRDQVFSLFFTTRTPGERSGLGLPKVRSCVRAHDGFIDFSSREGKGTTFRVLLPVAGGTTT